MSEPALLRGGDHIRRRHRHIPTIFAVLRANLGDTAARSVRRTVH